MATASNGELRRAKTSVAWGATVCVVVGLLAAACGSSGTSKASSGGTASKAPIVIGITASETGADAQAGLLALRGTELGVAQLNKSGGLLGRKVELKVYDDQSNPALASQLYTRLIAQDTVNLIVGPYGPTLADAVATVAARYHYLDIDPETAVPPVGGGGWAILGISGATQYFAHLPQAILASGLHTIAVVGSNNSFGIGCAKSVQSASKSAGVKVVYSGQYNSGSTNFSSMAISIKNANPDVVAQCSFYTGAVDLARALNSASFSPKVLAQTVGPTVPTFPTALGALSKRIVSSTSWSPTIATPGNAAFLQGYKAMFGTAPDYHAASNYSAVEVLAALVKKTGSLNQNRLRAAAYSMTIPTVQGNFRLNADGTPHDFKSYLVQFQNGQLVLVWPPSVARAKLQIPYGG